MLKKPELYISLDEYGYLTRTEFSDIEEELNEFQLGAVKTVIKYAYQDGVKDGIAFFMRIDTN